MKIWKNPNKGGFDILVVEDDDLTSRALSHIFAHHNFSVKTADSLEDGLKLIHESPRFILLDIILPDGDGTEILCKIKELHLRTKSIVTTGIIDPEEIQKILDCKPDLFLQKPIDFVKLLEFLKS